MRALGSDEFKAAIALPDEVCKKHAKVVDLFCHTHDDIGCSTCMALEHRSCDRVVYIPTMGPATMLGEINQFQSELLTTIASLEPIQRQQQAIQSDLDESKQSKLQEFDNHLTHMHALLDTIVGVSKDTIRETYDKTNADFTKQSQDVDKCLAELKVSKGRFDSCNVSQKFIEMKKFQKIRTQVDVCLLSNRPCGHQRNVKDILVNIDKRLETLLVEMKNMVIVQKPVMVETIVAHRPRLGRRSPLPLKTRWPTTSERRY